jgi:hypothetical protein
MYLDGFSIFLYLDYEKFNKYSITLSYLSTLMFVGFLKGCKMSKCPGIPCLESYRRAAAD